MMLNVTLKIRIKSAQQEMIEGEGVGVMAIKTITYPDLTDSDLGSPDFTMELINQQKAFLDETIEVDVYTEEMLD